MKKILRENLQNKLRNNKNGLHKEGNPISEKNKQLKGIFIQQRAKQIQTQLTLCSSREERNSFHYVFASLHDYLLETVE